LSKNSFIKILILILLSINSIFAVNNLDLEIFEDKNSTLNINQVRDKEFKKLLKAQKIYKYNKSTFWIKFTISNETKEELNYYIKTFEPYLRVVNLHRFENGKFSVKKNGYIVTYNERDFESNFIIFKEQIPKDSKIEFYLEIQDREFDIPKIYILNEQEFEFEYRTNLILTGFVYGVYLVMILYNFFIYLSIRDRAYFYYIIYHFMAMLTLLSLDTYPNIVFGIDIFLIHIVSNTAQIFLIKFTKHFLNSKKSKKLNRILNITLYMIYAMLTCSFFLIPFPELFTLYFPIDNFVKFFTLISIFIVSIYFYFKKDVDAKIYTLIWAMISLLFFLMIVIHFNSELFNGVIYLGGHLIFILELTLFSFALASRVNRLKAQKQRSEAIMLKKAKLADMGIMLNSISHQWRQPLTQIGSTLMNLQLERSYGDFSDKKFFDSIETINGILKDMSMTIDDFRSYVKSDSKKREFEVKKALDKALKICESAIKSLSIDVEVENFSESRVFGVESELTQVFINILTNLKHIFEEQEITNPYIKIDIIDAKSYIEILFLNNGVVKREVLSKVFSNFSSTKEQVDSGSFELFIIKDLINKSFFGEIEILNKKEKSCFKIKIPISNKEKS